MKRLILGVLAAASLGSVALAQGWAGDGRPCPEGGRRGGGPGAGAGARFDPATVTTISGEVATVDGPQGGRGRGVHLQVKGTDGRAVEVRLGPAWYLEQQQLTIQKGDQVEVTGSEVQHPAGTVLVAQSVKKGDATLTLRDGNGVPAWAGWRQR